MGLVQQVYELGALYLQFFNYLHQEKQMPKVHKTKFREAQYVFKLVTYCPISGKTVFLSRCVECEFYRGLTNKWELLCDYQRGKNQCGGQSNLFGLDSE